MASKFFYQRDNLALIQKSLEQRRFLSASAQAHAVLIESNAEKRAMLLAVDSLSPVYQLFPGQPSESRRFSVYGYQISHPGLPGFTGQVPETLTGGYMLGNGYRLYLGNLMRFASFDGWSPFGTAEINGYAYCKGDPVNNSDPSGHARLSILHKRANQFVDRILYETVKAMHGRAIIKKIEALPVNRHGLSPQPSLLSPAEAKVGGKFLYETLKFQEENFQQVNQRRIAASHGREGSLLIHAEPPGYIADHLVLKQAQLLDQIDHTKDLIGRVSNYLSVQSSANQIRSSQLPSSRSDSRRG